LRANDQAHWTQITFATQLIAEIEYREKPAKKLTGKPKTSSQTKTTAYQVTGEIETRISIIEAEKIV
jgi:hypothetical protein